MEGSVSSHAASTAPLCRARSLSCCTALHGNRPRSLCSTKERPTLSVVFLTVLYWTAESNVPGKGFHAVVAELAALAGASGCVPVLLCRFHLRPPGL